MLAPLRVVFVVFAVVALPAMALAQPQFVDHTPDRLPIGTVYVDSIVEASFVVYEAGKTVEGVKLEVVAPPFVKVLDTKKYIQSFGAGNDFVAGFVTIAIDTSKAGDYSGEFKVQLGKLKVKLPISVTVLARAPGTVRMLVVGSPFQRHTTDNADEYRAWTDLVKSARLDVDYLVTVRGQPALRKLDLSKYGVVLIGPEGLFDLTADDTKKVRAFAEGGGRVVVVAQRVAIKTVELANKLLDGYGLEMKDDEAAAREDSHVIVRGTDFAPELVNAKIAAVHFFRASPITVTDKTKARILVNAVGAGLPGDGFVAMAKAGKGEVMMIGQSLWWHWIGNEKAAGTDNAKLLKFLILYSRGV